MKTYKLISCEVLYRELCHALARSPHKIDVEFLPKGLHDIGCTGMLARLQAVVDRVEASRYDAILLGYGLCNYGISGLRAPSIPIVVPRAHDCITLFLGSKERYLDYFQNHSGVYFKTTGWIERGANAGQLAQTSISRKMGFGSSLEELVEKYGEENAQFLFDQINNYATNYSQFTFIEMGIEPDDRFEKHAQQEARDRGWSYEKIQGDMSLIERLINGPWDDNDFLVVPPGRKIAACYNEQILGLEEA